MRNHTERGATDYFNYLLEYANDFFKEFILLNFLETLHCITVAEYFYNINKFIIALFLLVFC